MNDPQHIFTKFTKENPNHPYSRNNVPYMGFQYVKDYLTHGANKSTDKQK